MAASQLRLYNDALRLVHERKLTATSDNREAARLLEDAWGDGSTNGSVRRCLEMGQWTFATRTAQIDYSPSVTPSFGYRYAFDYPTDFVRLAGLYQDEYCHTPLTLYSAERGYWYCDLQTIFVQYVSNGATYGGDLSLWPETFAKTVAADLAHEIAGSLTQDKSIRDDVIAEWRYWKKEAGALDAMNRPTKMLPQGRWLNARGGGRTQDHRWNGETV